MRNETAFGAIALTMLLLAAGCGKDKPGNLAKAGEETASPAGSTAEPPPPADVGDAEGQAAGETADVTPVKNAVEAARSGVRRPSGWAPASAGRGSSGKANARAVAGLARYVHWRPRESEGGKSFLTEPAVRKAIAANVRDAGIRNFIYHYSGPDAPIARRGDGRLIAWGCEAQKCGFHNWAVAIASDGSRAEVCYYRNDDEPDGTSTWYLPGGRTVKRDGNCPDE